MPAATARLALPYPVGADTPDVPRDVKALADRLELVVTPATLALPAAPVDGQVAYLAVAPGVVWAFRWNAGSASGFKWEFVGGAPWTAVNAADQTINPTTTGVWVDDANAPSLTIPRAGEYEARMGAYMGVSSAAVQNLTLGLGYTVPAGAVVVSAFAVTVTLQQNYVSTSAKTGLLVTETAVAGTVLKTRSNAGTSGGNVFFNGRWLSLVPRRVA